MKLRIVASAILVTMLSVGVVNSVSAHPHWGYRRGWCGPRVAVRVCPPVIPAPPVVVAPPVAVGGYYDGGYCGGGYYGRPYYGRGYYAHPRYYGHGGYYGGHGGYYGGHGGYYGGHGYYHHGRR